MISRFVFGIGPGGGETFLMKLAPTFFGLLLFAPLNTKADGWSHWHGADRISIAAKADYPTTFSNTENLREN
ncbi:MAG: hypothetical protein P1U58_09020 [Verrucomicrobiales bacterium]|nr:hypothetical protein [Verrucomicrobiales bacterium]